MGVRGEGRGKSSVGRVDSIQCGLQIPPDYLSDWKCSFRAPVVEIGGRSIPLIRNLDEFPRFARLFGKKKQPSRSPLSSSAERPGIFYAELNRKIEAALGSDPIGGSSPYYANSISREIISQLQDATLLEIPEPVEQQGAPFSSRLKEYFREPRAGDVVRLHLNLDPLGFSDVEVIYNLPTVFQDEAARLIATENNFNRLLPRLRENDVEACVRLALLIVQGRPDEGGIKKAFQEVDLTSYERTLTKLNEVFGDYDDKTFIQVLGDFQTSLGIRWSRLLYQARIYDGIEDNNDNDALPPELRWKPVVFPTREQERFYALLVGSPPEYETVWAQVPVEGWEPVRDENGEILNVVFG